MIAIPSCQKPSIRFSVQLFGFKIATFPRALKRYFYNNGCYDK